MTIDRQHSPPWQGPWFSVPLRRTALRGGMAASLILVTLFGCSGGGGALSQADLRKYGISRSDDDDDEEEQPPATSVPNAAVANVDADVRTRPTPPKDTRPAETGSTPTPATRPLDSPAEVTSVTENRPPESAPEIDASPESAPGSSIPEQTMPASAASGPSGIEPIALRKPAQSLPNSERRQRSAENMERITQAVVEWIDSSYKLPTSVLKDSRGLPGLSWRVHILPLLGYEGLYQQFHLKEPWDSPHNKALLEFIPDEFVSPERFDDHTNYQLLVNGQALFSEREQKDKSEISDAPKIVMLAEVDDDFAVPWTCPFDYDITTDAPDRGLGHLREDGLFVGWMTGDVAVWPKPINTAHLFRAITFEAGDGMPFAAYMGYPPPTPGGAVRPSLSGMDSVRTTSSSTTSLAAPRNANSPTVESLGDGVIREALPGRDAILEAEGKVRQTYEGAFRRARTAPEFAQLAKKIHTQLTSAALPSAELFVGLRTAMNVAIRGRDAKLALRMLDEIDRRFFIDRPQFESNLLKGFLGEKGSLRTELSKASVLLPTLESSVMGHIRNDNFKDAEEVLGYGRAMVRTITDPESTYRWKVLNERVEQGKRRLPKVAQHIEHLTEDPSDPSSNFVVGWYLCVIKGNWHEGLSLLAKSENPKLRALAQLEVQEDDNLQRHIQLADAWWDYAGDNKKDDLVFEAAMQRARKWYLSASVGLADGLDRIRANNRLANIDRLIGKAELPGGGQRVQ